MMILNYLRVYKLKRDFDRCSWFGDTAASTRMIAYYLILSLLV
jgi:hypothetical protein